MSTTATRSSRQSRCPSSGAKSTQRASRPPSSYPDPTEDALEHRLQWAAGLLHDWVQGVDVTLFWPDRAWHSCWPLRAPQSHR